MKIWHSIEHFFGWNKGHVYSWYESYTGKLMIGFKCRDCETITHVHEVNNVVESAIKIGLYK